MIILSKDYGITQEYILEQYNNGKTTQEIIQNIGCTKSTFYRKLKEFNLDIEQISSKYLFKNKEWLQKQFELYKTPTAISKATGIPRTNITRYAEKYNIRSVIFNRKPKNDIDENYFETINTEHKAYWLGFIMADGYMYQKPNGFYEFNIKIKSTDYELIKNFAEDISFDVSKIKIQQKYRKDTLTEGCCLRTANQIFCKNLLDKGIIPRKSGQEYIPEISNDLIPHFIRGFWDGDGSILFYPEQKCNPKIATCCSMSFKIIEQINSFFEKNNIHFEKGEQKTKNEILYILRSQNYNNVCKFINLIYQDATIYLERKFNTAQQILEYYSK